MGSHLACGDAEDYVSGRIEQRRTGIVSEYGMSRTTDLTMDEAEDRIRTALAERGFGVLTEIDVAATLKAKIDVDRPPYKILGACNPVLANQALQHDERIGLLLPCNVTLSQRDGGTVVSIVDPGVLLGIAGSSPRMDELATEARAKLEEALATLPGGDVE
jgi:uncharacterized protein (DUF302 family)